MNEQEIQIFSKSVKIESEDLNKEAIRLLNFVVLSQGEGLGVALYDSLSSISDEKVSRIAIARLFGEGYLTVGDGGFYKTIVATQKGREFHQDWRRNRAMEQSIS